MTRRELRLRAQAEAERAAAEAAAAEATAENAPTPPGGDVGTAGVPLTRRELRQMRLLQETGEIPAVTDEAPPAPVTAEPEAPTLPAPPSRPAPPAPPAAAEPAAEAPTLPAPPSRPAPPAPPAVEGPQEDDRHTQRRRPVLPPQTTGSTPVIDPETGTIGAIAINFPISTAEPVVNLPPLPAVVKEDLDFDAIVSGASSERADAAPPEPEPAVDAASPKRASLFEKLNEDAPIEGIDDGPEDHRELTVEQVAVRERSNPGVTFLRYLVLVLAMFVLGGLIWIIADRAAAVEVAEGIALVVTQGSSV